MQFSSRTYSCLIVVLNEAFVWQGKLDSYREKMVDGEELNKDQKVDLARWCVFWESVIIPVIVVKHVISLWISSEVFDITSQKNVHSMDGTDPG